MTPTSRSKPGEKYYQLTHDYLVPSLRDWLTRKQKETRRGRAELLLADRAAVWNARPENRQLPSLLQWLQIRWLTQKKNWTPPQRKMMRQGGPVSCGARAGGRRAAGRASARGLAIRAGRRAAEGTMPLDWCRLLECRHGPSAGHRRRRWLPIATGSIRCCTRPTTRRAGQDRPQELHASLALLPVDAAQVDYLYGRLLDAEPNEVPVIRDALAPHKDDCWTSCGRWWRQPEKGKESQRLRAAAALAKYDPESEKWAKVKRLVWPTIWCGEPGLLGPCGWKRLRPVQGQLLAPLSAIYRDHSSRDTAERTLATDILADYAADQPQVLADLLMDADEKQFAVIYPKFKEQGEQGLPRVDRRDRQEAAVRPAILGRATGKAGEAAGECGGGPAAG